MLTNSKFDLVSQNNQSTVVAEFKSKTTRETGYQSEAELLLNNFKLRHMNIFPLSQKKT